MSEPADALTFATTEEIVNELKSRHPGVVVCLWDQTMPETSRVGVFYRGDRVCLRGLLAEANDAIVNNRPETRPHDDDTSTPGQDSPPTW